LRLSKSEKGKVISNQVSVCSWFVIEEDEKEIEIKKNTTFCLCEVPFKMKIHMEMRIFFQWIVLSMLLSKKKEFLHDLKIV